MLRRSGSRSVPRQSPKDQESFGQLVWMVLNSGLVVGGRWWAGLMASVELSSSVRGIPAAGGNPAARSATVWSAPMCFLPGSGKTGAEKNFEEIPRMRDLGVFEPPNCHNRMMD
jgi:hypothetical protein